MLRVCSIRKQHQDNWLRTHFIEVGDAERIYIEIEFSMRLVCYILKPQLCIKHEF